VLKDCCGLGVNFAYQDVRDFIRVCLLYQYKRGKVFRMPVDKYRGVTLQRELIDKIEQYIEDYPEQGYKSIADFVTDAIRRRAEELNVFKLAPRFEHFNVYEDHATIWDKKLSLAVDVYPREDGTMWCKHCESTDCEHVEFALTVPEIIKPLEKRGWSHKG